MDTVDCFGDICPLPIIKIENKLKNLVRRARNSCW